MSEVEEVPAAVEALDGVESEDEAHNVERPARASGTAKHRKKNNGTPLADLEVGSQVDATVKNIASYGAFLDIGAASDALLHVSRLSSDFVANVEDVVKQGDKVSVRIVSVDTEKGQVAVSMLSEEDEQKQAQARKAPRGKNRPQRSGGDRQAQMATIAALAESGYDSDKFVEGQVVSTLDFGAFVRISTADLAEGSSGEIDGLCHISCLSKERVNSVSDIVSVGDTVQVRLKSVDTGAGRVSLSMISAADEPAPRERRGGGRPKKEQFTTEEMGNLNWKEDFEKFMEDKPTFSNMAVVVDKRK